jgi:ribose transport system ATP-binding protein
LLTVGESSYELARLDPATALEAGIALLPADRTNDGGAGSLSVLDNVVLPVIDGYVSRGKLARRRMLADTRDLLERFDVRPREPAAKLSSLSGGNQQRALLAKWLQKPVRLLIVHEPTQGVDVGARQQINEIIRARADAGLAVLCASSDYEQLAALCDRVMIFGRGRVVDELGGTDVNKDQIAASCYQSDSGTGSFDAPDQADLTLARSRR